MELSYDPVIPLLGIYLEKPETLTQKNINGPMFIAVIYDHQDMEAAQVSISRWMDKTTMGHLHNGILLGHKKNKKNLPFATAWMDLENIMLSEISQSEKDEYHVISLICGT